MEFNNRKLTSRALFPVGVNAYVIRDGKLLLGKRKDVSGYHDGEWGFPGGHMEEGESMIACVKRELEEETGLIAHTFTLKNVDNDPREDLFHYVHFNFFAEDAIGEVHLREPDRCYEWGWFALDALPQPIFLGHQRAMRGLVENKLFME